MEDRTAGHGVHRRQDLGTLAEVLEGGDPELELVGGTVFVDFRLFAVSICAIQSLQ